MADQVQMQSAEPGAPGSLFANVAFNIVRSQNLTEDFATELAAIIKSNGGTEYFPAQATGKLPLKDLTHIISADSDFPGYYEAFEALIPIIKPTWVQASLSKNKLAQIQPYSSDPRLFFSGVTVCCTDLPSGDEEAIMGGVTAMGGQYSSTLTKMVTHLVALTEESEKCRQAIERKMRCKIVLPHWFDDCLKLGQRIDEAPYTLPNPEIGSLTISDPVTQAPDVHLVGASNTHPNQLPSPCLSPSASRRDLTVFQKKRVLLSNDLDLGRRLRGIIEDLIESGGGVVTGSVHKTDMLICRYREGKDYTTASRRGKDVGNLSWLYFLLTHNTWTSPLRRLLHYPVARGGLPGFDKFRISLSNYGGEARLYLQNLVQAAGGEFTKTMRQDNTHLITARPQSEKCAAAKEWNIHMINHLWLEESYAKWAVQSVSDPRYTHFPVRTNLGEVVGQTQVDRGVVARIFFPGAEDDQSSSDNGSRARTSSGPMRRKDQNISPKKPRTEAEKAKPARGAPKLSVEGETPKRTKPGHEMQTPANNRIIIEGKENGTPSSTGSRGAKDRAMARLHELAPDIALYEKEKKRVGGVVFGGRKASDEARVREEPKMKRKASHQSSEDESEAEIDGERQIKKAKKTKLPSPVMKLILTGYQRWTTSPENEDKEKRKLRELGIKLVNDPSQCSHLAAPAIKRTAKFVATVAFAPTIISTDFIDHCLQSDIHGLPDVKDYQLQDKASEERLGFRLKDSLKRAKTNKRRLLAGTNVYCSPHVHGGYETYKTIVEVNGGRCILFRPRHGSATAKGLGEKEMDVDSQGSDPSSVYLLTRDSPEDRNLWARFRLMVAEQGKTARLVNTDWLLDVAMSQRMGWDAKYELS